MKHLTIILFSLFISFSLSAQKEIKGQIFDENDEALYGASAVLLDAIDSTMVAFAVSNESGKFLLEDLEAGKYLLQVSYVGYSNSYNDIDLAANKIDDLIINLEPSTEKLNEITIKAEKIPMGIRGDTISYNASAFKTRAGATVEDLLKKLPGVEVDRDGSIKAQGEDVENVLVDGKEFFGQDPLIATKNLEAEAVDKVEVYDKKSEIAEFTGIDDGQEEKTINLKLKEEHKAGGFGNVGVNGGTEDTWKANLNYNRFNPKMQASIIMSGNNINEQAFSFNEYISFMGGIGNAIAGGGITNFNFSNFQAGGFQNQGINKNYSLGTNLNYDFSKKLQLISNYFFIENENDLINNINSENFTNNLSYSTIDSTQSVRNNRTHRFNSKFIYKLNPYSEFIFKNNVQYLLDGSNELSNTINTQQSEFISQTNSMFAQDRDQLGLESQLQYKQKFSKKGRNWINTLNYKQATIEERNDVLNEFLLLDKTDLLNQFQQYNNKQRELTFRSDYTEPLGNKTYASFSYNGFLNREKPTKDFFDIVENQQILNNDLSSIFNKEVDYHRVGSSFRKNSKNIKFNTGLSYQQTSLRGIINEGQQSIDRSFNHWLPFMSFDLETKKLGNFSASYYTTIQVPSLSQLMPLPDNSNPNLFIQGNPNLIPEYNHGITLNYNYYDQFSFTNMHAYFRINRIKNRIVNQTSFDENLIRTVEPINTDNFLSVRGSFSFSKPIRPLKINTRISSSLDLANYDSFLDGILNQVSEKNINLSFQIDNRKKTKFDVATGIRLDFNKREYSTNSAFNQNFFNYEWFVEADWYVTEKLSVSASYDNRNYSQEFFSDNFNFQILTMTIQQKLAKDRITLSLIGRDLLNQNIGFDRYGTVNSLRESEFNALGRYIMLGVSYKLTKTKAPGGLIMLD